MHDLFAFHTGRQIFLWHLQLTSRSPEEASSNSSSSIVTWQSLLSFLVKPTNCITIHFHKHTAWKSNDYQKYWSCTWRGSSTWKKNSTIRSYPTEFSFPLSSDYAIQYVLFGQTIAMLAFLTITHLWSPGWRCCGSWATLWLIFCCCTHWRVSSCLFSLSLSLLCVLVVVMMIESRAEIVVSFSQLKHVKLVVAPTLVITSVLSSIAMCGSALMTKMLRWAFQNKKLIIIKLPWIKMWTTCLIQVIDEERVQSVFGGHGAFCGHGYLLFYQTSRKICSPPPFKSSCVSINIVLDRFRSPLLVCAGTPEDHDRLCKSYDVVAHKLKQEAAESQNSGFSFWWTPTQQQITSTLHSTHHRHTLTHAISCAYTEKVPFAIHHFTGPSLSLVTPSLHIRHTRTQPSSLSHTHTTAHRFQFLLTSPHTTTTTDFTRLHTQLSFFHS